MIFNFTFWYICNALPLFSAALVKNLHHHTSFSSRALRSDSAFCLLSSSSLALSSSNFSCSSAFSRRFSPPTMIFFSICASFCWRAACSDLKQKYHTRRIHMPGNFGHKSYRQLQISKRGDDGCSILFLNFMKMGVSSPKLYIFKQRFSEKIFWTMLRQSKI